jgi:pantetheine-phosphate adenylyltransferase
MRVGIYTGSFDPLTSGHADVISNAGRLFDRLVAAVGVHPSKKPLFTAQERMDLIRDVCEDELSALGCELVVQTFSGLAVDAAHASGASVIVRGLRDATDFDYEMQMAGSNAALAPSLRTIFIPASPGVRHISSTTVRQIAELGGDVSSMTPARVTAALAAKFVSAKS